MGKSKSRIRTHNHLVLKPWFLHHARCNGFLQWASLRGYLDVLSPDRAIRSLGSLMNFGIHPQGSGLIDLRWGPGASTF